jgi:ribonuclease HII
MLREEERYELREMIYKKAVAWAVSNVDHEEIDRINILRASLKAMHLALDQLSIKPGFILVDGNIFTPYSSIPHKCMIKGDGTYFSIAAASILAKTYRDDYMKELHFQYPIYGWNTNKGYATEFHRNAIEQTGYSPFHRKSFHLHSLENVEQLSLNLPHGNFNFDDPFDGERLPNRPGSEMVPRMW